MFHIFSITLRSTEFEDRLAYKTSFSCSSKPIKYYFSSTDSTVIILKLCMSMICFSCFKNWKYGKSSFPNKVKQCTVFMRLDSTTKDPALRLRNRPPKLNTSSSFFTQPFLKKIRFPNLACSPRDSWATIIGIQTNSWFIRSYYLSPLFNSNSPMMMLFFPL